MNNKAESISTVVGAKQQGTRYMVQLALVIAIIFIMAFTPLGYFRTPGLSVTFLTVPVAVGAIILGPMAGAICGFAFGITSTIIAFSGTSVFSATLLSINPFGTIFTCIVPRILEGWLCGLIFQKLRVKCKSATYFIASLSCPILNTLLFMSSLMLFFYNSDYIQGIAASFGTVNPFVFVVLFVGLQGMIEAIICTIIATAVSRGLALALRK